MVKFLSVVLPTHQEYFSPEPKRSQQRHRSQAQLVELLQYMEELALLLDEIQYNQYVLQQELIRGGGPSSDDKGYHTASTNDTTLDTSTSQDTTTTTEISMEEKVAAVVAAQAQQQTPPTTRNPEVVTTTTTTTTTLAKEEDEHAWNPSFACFETKQSRIDLLVVEPENHAHPNTRQKSSIPKLKQPPAALPRSVRAAATTSALPRRCYNPAPIPSPVAVDHPWNWEEKKESEPMPIKIEQRWNQAKMKTTNNHQLVGLDEWNPNPSPSFPQYDMDHYDPEDERSPSSLMRHFKGCVRCLVE